MSVDPLTHWFYRVALAAVALVCLCGAVALSARALALAGSASGNAGLRGLLAWWATKGKTYTASYGFMAWEAYQSVANGQPVNKNGLFLAVVAATLRMAIAKNQKASETAATAAKLAAFKMDPPNAKEHL